MKKTQLQALTIIAAAFGLLALAGCESMGNLSPANPAADNLSGDLAVHVTSTGTANGTIDVIGPNGEVLRGPYSPAPSGYTFGDIFKATYGQYSTMPTAADNGTPTVAMLTGNKGTTMQCEFYNDDYTGNGFGACKTQTGALYKLSY